MFAEDPVDVDWLCENRPYEAEHAQKDISGHITVNSILVALPYFDEKGSGLRKDKDGQRKEGDYHEDSEVVDKTVDDLHFIEIIYLIYIRLYLIILTII